MQNWKKLGKIFEVKKNSDWMYSHTTCPFSYHLTGDIFRFYFNTRDKNNYSTGAWVEVDINNPKVIKNISNESIISKANLGLFDDAGVVPFQIIKDKDNYLMYYSGWTVKKTIPFDFHIGVATTKNLNTAFTRYSKVPILDRTVDEPYLIGAPFVIKEEEIYKMWYISGDEWSVNNKSYKHYYSIKYAESDNGLAWNKRGITCISYDNEYEYAFARPFVIKENNIYKMWYCYRASKNIHTYRMGYSESHNGIKWDRKDEEVGIDVSKNGWDSEMICYPFIFDHKGKRYMLYNGNDYGKTGFGLAVLEDK